MKTETPPLRAALYAAAVILAVGALPLPFGYYGFLRGVAFLAFAYCAYVAIITRSWVTFLFTALALVVFNPVVPLRLTKDAWACIDAASAAYLAIVAKHVQTRFALYGPPDRTIDAIGRTLGFSVLLALIGGAGIAVLAGFVIIPLRWFGLEVSGKSLNPIAYATASGIAVAVLAGHAYHSGQRTSVPGSDPTR